MLTVPSQNQPPTISIQELNELFLQTLNREKKEKEKEKIFPKKEKPQPEKEIPTYHPEGKFFFEPQENKVVLRCRPQPESELLENQEVGQSNLDCIISSAPSSLLSSTGSSSTSSNEPHWNELFAKYRNSVVQVISINFKTNPAQPHESIQSGKSLGSAFFITEDGFLFTNAHVVIKSGKLVIKREIEGEKLIPVRVHNICPGKDCAILKMSKKTILQLKRPIVPFQFGDSDLLKVPEALSAFGYQLGMPDLKMTSGNLAGHHREASEGNRSSSFLQITTPIVQGSSGGCLINREGRVLGICAQGIPSAGGNVGFAISSKVVLSVLSPLLARNVYLDKIVPVPSLSFNYQTCNRSLLQANNVDRKYKGGLYVTERTCPYTPRSEAQELDIRPKDIVLEIRCVHPYGENRKYLELEQYQSGYFFPQEEEGEEEEASRMITSSLPLHQFLLDPTDKCYENYVIPDFGKNVDDFAYLTGGMKWNLSNPEDCFPALKVIFSLESEIIDVEEKKSQSEPWLPCKMYQDRKMFLSDFLDMLPAGIPLLYIINRKGEKMSIESMFHPILPKYEGLKYYYSPFQSFKKEYEIVAGLVFMTLLMNHFRVCLPAAVRRLEGKLRFKDAVVITHLFNLSTTSKLQVIEPLQVLKEFELFAPFIDPQTGQLRYQTICQEKSIVTIDDLRKCLLKCVQTGIYYFNTVIASDIEKFRYCLKENRLRREIQALRDGNQTWEQIDQILEEKYKVILPPKGGGGPEKIKIFKINVAPERERERWYHQTLDIPDPDPLEENVKRENFLLSKYVSALPSGDSWTNLLTFAIYLEKGRSIFSGFPEIFLEDYKIQTTMQIPSTPFGQQLYTLLQQELVQKFHPLFDQTQHSERSKKRQIHFSELTGIDQFVQNLKSSTT